MTYISESADDAPPMKPGNRRVRLAVDPSRAIVIDLASPKHPLEVVRILLQQVLKTSHQHVNSVDRQSRRHLQKQKQNSLVVEVGQRFLRMVTVSITWVSHTQSFKTRWVQSFNPNMGCTCLSNLLKYIFFKPVSKLTHRSIYLYW